MTSPSQPETQPETGPDATGPVEPGSIEARIDRILATPAQLRTALSAYKVMAIVAGVAMLVLIVEMTMKYGMDQNNFLTKNWSYIHGFLYMTFAASIANLGFKAAWPLTRIVGNMLTGFVPFLPFVAEPRVRRDTEELISRVEARG